MKKKMYYNMRIKTMQRSFSTLHKLIKLARERKMNELEALILRINCQLLEAGKRSAQDAMDQFKVLQKTVQEEILRQDVIYRGLKKSLYEVSKQSIHKLITELETGGNIRLEEGKGSEKWFISCVDLLRSRFFADDMAAIGIKDIEVKRVVRIHNRFLRNKFEEKLESLVDVTNNNYKKSLEYLFYGIDPKAPQEIFHILEEGFRSQAVRKS